MDANKQKALDAALAQIERQFGKGTVMRMGDQERVAIPAISTGSLGLDIALGIGGLPRGRIVEIYGPESSGKTTLTLQVIAEAQKAGARPPLSMQSTRWILSTQRNWACKWMISLCPSPTRASRRLRWLRCWFARVRSTYWWSIPWQH